MTAIGELAGVAAPVGALKRPGAPAPAGARFDVLLAQVPEQALAGAEAGGGALPDERQEAAEPAGAGERGAELLAMAEVGVGLAGAIVTGVAPGAAPVERAAGVGAGVELPVVSAAAAAEAQPGQQIGADGVPVGVELPSAGPAGKPLVQDRGAMPSELAAGWGPQAMAAAGDSPAPAGGRPAELEADGLAAAASVPNALGGGGETAGVASVEATRLRPGPAPVPGATVQAVSGGTYSPASVDSPNPNGDALRAELASSGVGLKSPSGDVPHEPGGSGAGREGQRAFAMAEAGAFELRGPPVPTTTEAVAVFAGAAAEVGTSGPPSTSAQGTPVIPGGATAQLADLALDGPPEQWVERLGASITALTEGETKTARVHLTPRSLGELTIVVELRDDRLSTQLFVDTPAAQQSLRDNTDQLRAFLAENGLKLEQSFVEIGGGTRHQAREQKTNENVSGDRVMVRNEPEAARAVPRPQGRLDVYA